MTQLSTGTIATDIDAADDNSALTERGCTIRPIQTWQDHDTTCILREAPRISEADCPF
jgi:hypothetical protein